MVTNFRQYFLGGKVGLASNLVEMSHKISVNYVDKRIAIHLLLALIVHCTYVFCSFLKFAQIQFLPFWVTTCEGMVQCANRSIKAFKGVPGDSAQ